MSWFTDLRGRYATLVEQYGKVAIVTYFSLFFGTWFAFWAAMKLGMAADGAVASAGTVGAAYVATKVTQPVRIAVTLVATPMIATLILRLRNHPRPELPEPRTAHRPGADGEPPA